MAQQNQENIPVDSASFPARKKRGRPRKYDDSGYEPRRRYLHSSSASMQGGSNQGSQAIPMLHNQNAVLGLGSQALSVQMNPTNTSVPSNQVISTEANYTSISGFRPQSVHSHANLAHSLSGPKHFQLQTNSTCNSGNVPNAAQTETNQTAGSSSYHGHHSLIGQAVCGVLDGAFDAGYLLTVRVGSTGEVLKGLVFDPCSIVPISEKNDIAPLLPVVSLGANLYPIAKAPMNEPTSASVHPAVTTPVSLKEPDAPTKSINHETEISANVSEFTNVSNCDDKQANHDASQIPFADIQATTLQDQILAVNNADDMSHQSVVEKESEMPACPSVTNKASSEAPVAKEIEKLNEIVGVDWSQDQPAKSSVVEPSGESLDLHQTDKQTENMNMELEDKEQHLAEDKSSGMLPTMQRSDEHVLLDEPKCMIDEQTLPMSVMPHDLFNAELSNLH